jgi:hypothetical protein
MHAGWQVAPAPKQQTELPQHSSSVVQGAASAVHVTQRPAAPLQLQVGEAQKPCAPGPPVQAPPGHVPAG